MELQRYELGVFPYAATGGQNAGHSTRTPIRGVRVRGAEGGDADVYAVYATYRVENGNISLRRVPTLHLVR